MYNADEEYLSEDQAIREINEMIGKHREELEKQLQGRVDPDQVQAMLATDLSVTMFFLSGTINRVKKITNRIKNAIVTALYSYWQTIIKAIKFLAGKLEGWSLNFTGPVPPSISLTLNFKP